MHILLHGLQTQHKYISISNTHFNQHNIRPCLIHNDCHKIHQTANHTTSKLYLNMQLLLTNA